MFNLSSLENAFANGASNLKEAIESKIASEFGIQNATNSSSNQGTATANQTGSDTSTDPSKIRPSMSFAMQALTTLGSSGVSVTQSPVIANWQGTLQDYVTSGGASNMNVANAAKLLSLTPSQWGTLDPEMVLQASSEMLNVADALTQNPGFNMNTHLSFNRQTMLENSGGYYDGFSTHPDEIGRIPSQAQPQPPNAPTDQGQTAYDQAQADLKLGADLYGAYEIGTRSISAITARAGYLAGDADVAALGESYLAPLVGEGAAALATTEAVGAVAVGGPLMLAAVGVGVAGYLFYKAMGGQGTIPGINSLDETIHKGLGFFGL